MEEAWKRVGRSRGYCQGMNLEEWGFWSRKVRPIAACTEGLGGDEAGLEEG
jgi:hypothetical protein